jgi:hypothetical protein
MIDGEDQRRLRMRGRKADRSPGDVDRRIELSVSDEEGLGPDQHVVIVGTLLKRRHREAGGVAEVALAFRLTAGQEVTQFRCRRVGALGRRRRCASATGQSQTYGNRHRQTPARTRVQGSNLGGHGESNPSPGRPVFGPPLRGRITNFRASGQRDNTLKRITYSGNSVRRPLRAWSR